MPIKASTSDLPVEDKVPTEKHPVRRSIEIYVGRGFCEFEAAAIAQALSCANEMLGEVMFSWHYVSETPGLLNGKCGMIVRAEPVVQDHELADMLFVVGGRSGREASWLPRLHQMRRLGRSVALLSDAATAYITRTKSPVGKVTTHWHDALSLKETGHHPKLTNSLSEYLRASPPPRQRCDDGTSDCPYRALPLPSRRGRTWQSSDAACSAFPAI